MNLSESSQDNLSDNETLDVELMKNHYNRMQYKSIRIRNAFNNVQTADKLDGDLLEDLRTFFDWVPNYKQFKNGTILLTKHFPKIDSFPQKIQKNKTLTEAYNLVLIKIGQTWEEIFTESKTIATENLRLVPFFFVSERHRDLTGILEELKTSLSTIFEHSQDLPTKSASLQGLFMAHAIEGNEYGIEETHRRAIRDDDALELLQPLLGPLFGNDFKWKVEDRLIEQNIEFIENTLSEDEIHEGISIDKKLKQPQPLEELERFYDKIYQSLE